MKAETPALGMMKTHEFDDSVYYKIECHACGQDYHSMELEIELEEEVGYINVNTHIKPVSPYWKNLVNSTSNIDNSFLWSIDYAIRQLINRLYHSVKVTWEVWTKGYVVYYHTTTMTEQQALNYCGAIKDSIKQLNKRKKGSNK